MALATGTVLTIGTVLAGGSLSYGIYTSERTRTEQANRYRLEQAIFKAQVIRDREQMAANELKQETLYNEQKAEQTATEDRLRGEQTAAIAKARGEIPGLQSKLGEDLLVEQGRAYAQMAPQLEARLNALGLLQSGALPEAQAKAFAELEGRRQSALADFGNRANYDLAIDRPLGASSADIGRQYEGMRANFDTRGRNLSQTFANQNAYNQNEAARMQYMSGMESARNAAAQSSANSYMQFGSQIGSGLISYYGQRQNPRLDALYDSRSSGGWGDTRGYGSYV